MGVQNWPREKECIFFFLEIEVTGLASQPQGLKRETMGLQNMQKEKRYISPFGSRSDWASLPATRGSDRDNECAELAKGKRMHLFFGSRNDHTCQPGTRAREKDIGCAELAKRKGVHLSLLK